MKIEAISEDPSGAELVRVKDKWYPRAEIEEQIEREQSRRRILSILFGIGLCITALAYSLAASAAQYKPTTEEALMIRPERPVERLQSSAPCLRPPEVPKRVTWVVRDEKGQHPHHRRPDHPGTLLIKTTSDLENRRGCLRKHRPDRSGQASKGKTRRGPPEH